MILKAGTYRFNDVLTYPFPIDGYINFDFVANGTSFNEFWCGEVAISYYGSIAIDDVYVHNEGWSADYGDMQTITISNDATVNDTFGTWYIANTNYNEVNAKPLVEITYNGETIAELNAGETATLPCKDMAMASDVVVKVNKIEEPVDDSIVGIWTFKSNVEELIFKVDIDFYGTYFPNPDYYIAMQGFIDEQSGEYKIRYTKQDGNTVTPYQPDSFDGWEDDYMQTIIIFKDPKNEAYKTWLKVNAKKQ